MRRMNALALACLVAVAMACGPSATGADPSVTPPSFLAPTSIVPPSPISAPANPTASGQAPSTSPQPTPTAAATPPATGDRSTAATNFSIDLYARGAFIRQLTTYYCVPASIQTMLNIVDGRPYDTSRETQDTLYGEARDDLIQPYWGRGTQPEGWATVLTRQGAGRYELGIRANATRAIHLAARQLRLTNRPVGLLVWRGFHAWVMSGFTSIGDPATGDNFVVTGVFVEDPWYPRISRTYGRGQAPDTFLTTRQLSRFFLPYDQHGEGGLDKDGKYVVVIPTT
jgi:hypothetical protein